MNLRTLSGICSFRFWIVVALLALMMSVACGRPRVPRGLALPAEAEAALRAFVQTWEREDLEAAVGSFTSDAVVFDPVPPGRFEGPNGIRAWTRGAFDSLEHIAINCSQIRTQTRGGPVAWTTSHFVFEAQQAGKPVRFEGDLTTVWVKQSDGSYKLSVFHASHLPEAAHG